MQKERQPDPSRQIYKQKLSGFFFVLFCFLSLHPPLGWEESGGVQSWNSENRSENSFVVPTLHAPTKPEVKHQLKERENTGGQGH